MSQIPSQNPNVQFHLSAPEPAHFRMRRDLVEELCIAETFAYTLPRSPDEHARWLMKWGISAAEVPFHTIASAIGRPYEPTPRYIFHPAILPGRTSVNNVVTDARGWSVSCEFGGLYDFVFARAVQFCESRGHQRSKVQALFYPKLERNPEPRCRYGWWAIEYECATGFCTILPRTKGEANRERPVTK
jgi:hypothetical protein